MYFIFRWNTAAACLLIGMTTNLVCSEPLLLNLAQVQPKGFNLSHIYFLDLHHNSSNNNTVIAYTKVAHHKESCKEHSIYIYDPHNMIVNQRIVLPEQSSSCSHGPNGPWDPSCSHTPSGSFSENGQFLTIGIGQNIHTAQDFYLFRKLEIGQCAQPLLGILPNGILGIIGEYENSQSGTYTLDKVITHQPPWTRQITQPNIYVDHFEYNSHNDTITCYGSSHHRVNRKASKHAIAMAQAHGSSEGSADLRPTAVITCSPKPGQRAVQLVDPQDKVLVKYWPTEYRENLIESHNRRYIVYQSARDKTIYRLDRSSNSRIILKKPTQYAAIDYEYLDNTGKMCLQGMSPFKANSQKQFFSIEPLPGIPSTVKPYRCIYPVITSAGYHGVCLYENFCFVKKLYPHGEFSGPYAISLIIPPEDQVDPTTTRCLTKRYDTELPSSLAQHPNPTIRMAHVIPREQQLFREKITNAKPPSLRCLENIAPLISIPAAKRYNFLSYLSLSRFAGFMGFIGFAIALWKYRKNS